MSSIEAVLFDYGLVLSGPPDAAAWEALKRAAGADEAPFFAAYWKHRHDYDRGALGGKTYWEAVVQELGSRLSAEQLSVLLAEDVNLWSQPNTPMIEWASRLQRAQIKTGILSNIGDAMEAGIRSHADWLSGFAHHTFSHRLGIAKPELAIYRHAANGLGVDTGRVLFIDDREENISAALQSGMHAIQYSEHTQFVHEMHDQGFGYLLEI